MDGSWIYEKHTDDYGVNWKIDRFLYKGNTEFQEIAVAESKRWGKMLLLDGVVQTTENDEFMYHEMITHVAMHSHPAIKNVLVIGGGDGGTLTQLIKHPAVERIDLVEIDGQVIEISQRYFPGFQPGFSDPRTNIIIKDGIEYLKNFDGKDGKYDLIIVDSSDPAGPATGLFTRSFYSSVYDALGDDGMMVVQSESPLFYGDMFTSIYSNIYSVFSRAYVYTCTIPTYISGPWTFTVGTKQYDPRSIVTDKPVLTGLKYYNREVHQAAFALPEFIKNMLLEVRG